MATVPALALLYPTLLASFARNYNYTIFPDEQGVLNLIDPNPPVLSPQDIEDLKVNLDNILFNLYTRANPGGEKLTIGDVKALKNSNFNPENPTRFVIHGWRSNGVGVSCTVILEAFLAVGEYNVIVVDWGKIAGSFLYGKVVKSIPDVSKRVAMMINFLRDEGGMDFSNTKVIGFSLGAHVAGLSANQANGTIGQVVALDPARPYYQNADADQRVDAVDADHVQVIHTSGGKLGIMEPIGTSDFYPNTGKKQPGCTFDIFGACSHYRSYYFYAESIRNPTGFVSILSENRMPSGNGILAYMGGPTLDRTAKGSYVLKTNSKPPYAKG